MSCLVYQIKFLFFQQHKKKWLIIGTISSGTLSKKLMELFPNYLDFITIENGKIILNEDIKSCTNRRNHNQNPKMTVRI